MIKTTTMAEAVRERPKGTKSKRVDKAGHTAAKGVSTSQAASTASDVASADHRVPRGSRGVSISDLPLAQPSEHAASAASPGIMGHGDLEVDSGDMESVADSDLDAFHSALDLSSAEEAEGVFSAITLVATEELAQSDSLHKTEALGTGTAIAEETVCAKNTVSLQPVSKTGVPCDTETVERRTDVNLDKIEPQQLRPDSLGMQSEPQEMKSEPKEIQPLAQFLIRQQNERVEVPEASAPPPSLEADLPLKPEPAPTEVAAPVTQQKTPEAEPIVQVPTSSHRTEVPGLRSQTTAVEIVAKPMERNRVGLYPTVPKLESPGEGRFVPLTLEQLQQLYYNHQLLLNDKFVEDFVDREEKKSGHPFCDIVQNYCLARKKLLTVEDSLKLLRQNYEHILNELWITNTCHTTVEGQCGDGSRVSKVYTYQQCEFNKDALANMASTLQSIRNEIQGDLALHAYSSQLSRLQVESYLHQLFLDCPLFLSLTKDAPVASLQRHKDDAAYQVQKVKDCISILFIFHRRPFRDVEFVENLRKWTERLVASLLRVATFSDHLFLLNHILRAPGGVCRWASTFIQIPAPASLALQTTLGGPVLDHVVTCLATVLLPIRAREKFMQSMRINVTESSLQLEQEWALVDSDGEEDDDPSQAWLYLHENDLVGVLNQFPLDAVFAHLLQATIHASGSIHYDVSRCTEPSMMKLFAFCTTWISLLGTGLSTYSMTRYRQLNKRLGRLIRQTIAFVSDHWLNFKSYYGPLASPTSMERLQMEFDQLFMRATYTILTAQKLGSWQFMADMPFTCLSAGSVWRLLWLLQQGHEQPIDLHTLPPVAKCKEDMKDIESRRQLADALINLPTSESIFLLTTFANMAAARPLEEDEFIECITLQVFEIAYICNHTRDLCSKTGRQLLSSVIQKHPTAFSMLLRRVQGVIGELGMMSLYLFSELPASIWIPQDPDMLLLRQWLLNNELSSPESQLACTVLDRMNWDLFTETGKLVLDIRLHRQVALLLVEAYTKFISDRKASFFIVEGMKQMASYAYTSSSGTREQQFNNWVWSLALRLKLHRQAAILQSRAAESHPFTPPDMEKEGCLLMLSRTVRNKNPLACFLAVSMTVVGHDPTLFIAEGLDMVMTLAASSQYTAVIHGLACLIPQFLDSSHYLIENQTFLKIVHMVMSADESVLKITKQVMGAEFKAGAITQQFTQMIQYTIAARLESGQGLPLLLFWVQVMFKVANFLSDLNCCYVLDHLVRWGYLMKGARDKLDVQFQLYHKLLGESKTRGGFLNWVGGGGSSPSLMERSSMPEFGWLAIQVLQTEEGHDSECRLWPSLQQELIANPTMSVEQALKTVCGRLGLDQGRSANRLGLYRWAQQALEMPLTHPMMPVVWQHFFSLYLGRCALPSQIPVRASVGERFFQSASQASVLKRMKKRLAEAADYHLLYDPAVDAEKKIKDNPTRLPRISSRTGSEAETPMSSPQTEDSPQYNSTKEFHNQLARLYETFSLWLDESRLHGADLYLPALPPPYEASRLLKVFTQGSSPWLEFVDFEGVQYDILLFAAEWQKLVSGRPQFGSQSLPHRRSTMSLSQNTATDRIRQRLQRCGSPLAPPALHPVAPPVPDIPPALLMDKSTALHLLDTDISTLTDFTKLFSDRAAQQCAVDVAYLELIPGQCKNTMKVTKVAAECRGGVNLFHRCKGPAMITVKVEEHELNQVIQRKIDENRAEYKQLMIEAVLPPPQSVCTAAVHVENAITMLVNMWQKVADPQMKAVVSDVACTLFFHLTGRVDQETNFYLPTRQFFSSCVEILGKEFVSQTASQTGLVLQFSLDNQQLAGMVAPHFSPNNNPQALVTMYEQLIGVLQDQNLHLVFMLLSKFDVRAWLEECHPPPADRIRLMEALGSALLSCGAEPAADTKMIFDLYLAHLRCILQHQFPANLSSVLSLLLQGSSREGLHTSCWEMMLMECCNSATGSESRSVFSREQVEACHTIPLPTEQLQELLQYLAGFFLHERQNQERLSSFGLYPTWGRYVPYIAMLIGWLARCFVSKVFIGMQDHNPGHAMQAVWVQQFLLWQPWMEPLSAPPGHPSHQPTFSPDLRPPWTEVDSTIAATMVESFRSTVMFTYNTLLSLAPTFSSKVLSLLLMHYMTRLCHRSTEPHVAGILASQLSLLPWDQLRPDLILLETMAQLKEHCSPTCFQLIGHILPRVPWGDVITSYKLHLDVPDLVPRMQAALLVLFVQCYGDSSVRETPEINQLLTAAESLDWSGLTAEAFRNASYWFLQVCQPQWVLAQRSSTPALGFRLMKSAAEFTPSLEKAWNPTTSVKRLTYIHCLTQQLCQVTYLASPDLDALSTVLLNLLSEIESVESSIVDIRCQEEESLDLMKEVLNLLNNSNPDGASQSMLLQTLCHWLQSSPHSILLTPCIKGVSRCLASLTQMVTVTETCIHVYFTAYSQDRASGGGSTITLPATADADLSGWSRILAVLQAPELNQEQYVSEAVANGAYLLLYALLLHRRPLCQSAADEGRMMEDILAWTAKAQPSADNEAKLLLWWMELFHLWLRQLDAHTSLPLCIIAAQRLVALLHQLGEDRCRAGFLGVIGLGKRSQLSLKFRLAVRSIAAFLSSQILSETALRLQSSAPLSDLPMAKQSRSSLMSLRGNGAYASLKDQVESMIAYVGDTEHTVRDIVALVRQLALSLYDFDYIVATLK